MKSERCNKIARLKFPLGKRAINDFKSDRKPFSARKRRGGIGRAPQVRRLSQAKNNFGFDLQGTRMRNGEGCGVAITVMYRVVVHVRPNQRLKFENAPHRLIRVSNFSAACWVSSRFAEFLERCFHLVGRIKVEA